LAFQFKFHKSPDTTEEEFLSAIACAKNCIESVLYDNNPVVTISGNTIFIDRVNITIKQCEEQVRGCFCDSFNHTYPESKRVEVF
jgi:hypothetical protein